MVLCLELHSSHQQQPEKILMFVVSASHDLVVNEGHLRILSEPDFFLVVSNQHESRVEPRDKASNDEIDEISAENVQRCVVS